MLRDRDVHVPADTTCGDERMKLRSQMRNLGNRIRAQRRRPRSVYGDADSFHEPSDSLDDIQASSDDLSESESEYVPSQTCPSPGLAAVRERSPVPEASVHISESPPRHDKTQSTCAEKFRPWQQCAPQSPESAYATAFVVKAAQLLNKLE